MRWYNRKEILAAFKATVGITLVMLLGGAAGYGLLELVFYIFERFVHIVKHS